MVTYSRYAFATKWPNQCLYIVTQKSKMAALNPKSFFF